LDRTRSDALDSENLEDMHVDDKSADSLKACKYHIGGKLKIESRTKLNSQKDLTLA